MNEQQRAQLHQDMVRVEQLIVELGNIARQDTDIHIVAPRIGELCRDFLRIAETNKDLINELYPLKPFPDVIAEIIAVSGKDIIVENIIARIQAMPAIEAETGLNTRSVLQLSWSLHKSDAAKGSGLIIDNLKHNLASGGHGCNAGIAARIAVAYGDLLHTALVSIYNEEVYAHLGVNVNSGGVGYENDDEYEAAVNESLEFAASAAGYENDDEYEATVKESLEFGASAAGYENDEEYEATVKASQKSYEDEELADLVEAFETGAMIGGQQKAAIRPALTWAQDQKQREAKKIKVVAEENADNQFANYTDEELIKRLSYWIDQGDSEYSELIIKEIEKRENAAKLVYRM